ncbi:MAG: hypothetical protein O7E57_02685 [Gammaproteobacteria bacterium]|nr:hypothetical protein [Gammaproteobacteria bacterium]
MQFREKARLALVFWLSGLATVGCQTGPKTPPIQIPSDPEPVLVKSPDVDGLLQKAELALTNDQLAYPETGSALTLFGEVLTLDPANPVAIRGLERIVERYLELAQRAAQRRQFAQARSMVSRARLIDPANPAIEATASQVQLLSSARRERLELDKSLLSARSETLLQPLTELGGKARAENCRTTITARSDAEGRWLYRQLNQAKGERRIRAQLQIGSPPQVEVLCF